MASIEYAIDINGKKVYANKAINGHTYICPYCFEEIIVRKHKNNNRKDYFAHKSISNRTPQQRICPGYTGNINNKKIENIIDKVYISNGGIPLYLLNISENRYILQAHFPSLSYETTTLLNQWNSKVIITENSQSVKYSIDNIKPYIIKSTDKWISVKCENMNYPIKEVSQKWEWGIRGISFNNDFFHSDINGGFRVAQHSNIVVDKEYFFISYSKKIPTILGISFKEEGIIELSSRSHFLKEYFVFSLKVVSITEESIAFVQSKGYQLTKKIDSIIPLWPPAIIKGKELIYQFNDKQTYLYHSKKLDQEVYCINSNDFKKIDTIGKIIHVPTINNIIVSSDYKFNLLSNEIRYRLTCKKDAFFKDKIIDTEVIYRCDDGNNINFKNSRDNLFNNKKICIESNVPLDIIIGKENYVEYSSKKYIKVSKKHKKIILDLFAFGLIEKDNQIKQNFNNTFNIIDLDLLSKILYKCNSALIPFNFKYLVILDYIKNKNTDIYKIIYKWSINKKMPYVACKYLDNIMEVIKNE